MRQILRKRIDTKMIEKRRIESEIKLKQLLQNEITIECEEDKIKWEETIAKGISAKFDTHWLCQTSMLIILKGNDGLMDQKNSLEEN